MIRVIRPPYRLIIRPDTGAKATIAKPDGTIANPAMITERPKPYPVAVGNCNCWVVSSRFANIAKPTRTEAMLVSNTGRRAEVRRSTSGCPTFNS